VLIDPQVIHDAAARGDRIYPYAAWMPIPEALVQARITVRSGIFHSMAGPRLTSIEDLRAYMARDDIHIESTFILDFDGRMAQVCYFDQRADCNYRANAFAFSVETQDEGSATLATTPWSPAQVDQLAGLAAFAHLRDGVPLELPPRWDSGGIGYHRLHPEWSVYQGKSCPGDTRVAQMPEILASAAQIVAWRPETAVPSPNPQEVVDMYLITHKDPKWPGHFIARVSSDTVDHAQNGDAVQVDQEAGVPTVELTRPRLLAALRDRGRVHVSRDPGGKVQVGQPFVGEYADAELAAAWATHR
jgi:hypothetical protein